MAFTKIQLTNGIENKVVPLGFSWTTFFWGGWPALFRGDWLWFLIILIPGLFTYGFTSIVFAFFYNKIYAKSLFNKGYRVSVLPVDTTEAKILSYLGYITLPKQGQ